MSEAKFVITAVSSIPSIYLGTQLHHWVEKYAIRLNESRVLGTVGIARFEFTSSYDLNELRSRFADELGHRMTWHMQQPGTQRVLVLVSKKTYALAELLDQWASGCLGAEIVGVVGNHKDAAPLVESRNLEFRHIPVEKDNKEVAEAQLLDLVHRWEVDLVVMARYMQILSPALCNALEDAGTPVINLHHGDVLSCPGADPYRQALLLGATHVAATAHYATADLDRGPIIMMDWWPRPVGAGEQELARVGRRGASVLADAVRAHCDGRVVVVGKGCELL